MLWIVSIFLLTASVGRSDEQRFEVLKIGTQVYSNVTVTTKSQSYIFILHATGMLNLKVAELPNEVRQQLGYNSQEAPAGGSKNAGSSISSFFKGLNGGSKDKPSKLQGAAQWQQANLASLQSSPQAKYLREHANFGQLKTISRKGKIILITIVAGLFFVYFFFAYCFFLICKKGNASTAGLAWIPFLQVIPLLQAAGMSPWWILSIIVPPIAFIIAIVWCFRLAKALGKSAWVGFFLLLPVTNLFAYLYLAFSGEAAETPKSRSKPKRDPTANMMVLETA